jgi:tetratricopeptide (TPR) repeat protein
MGQSDDAREAYDAALAIRERLAAGEPERADFQRDLAISYDKMGFLFSAMGQGEEARKAYAAALAIRERLAADEPERADSQRDLASSCEHLAALAELDDRSDDARRWFERALEIIDRLHAAEPVRADYQIDLVNDLINTARHTNAPTPARALLERAASILHDLHAGGRLPRADRRKIGVVARMRAALSQQVSRQQLQRPELAPSLHAQPAPW